MNTHICTNYNMKTTSTFLQTIAREKTTSISNEHNTFQPSLCLKPM